MLYSTGRILQQLAIPPRCRVCRCYDQKVHVVAHEHVAVEKKSTFLLIDARSLKVPVTVAFVAEDILSLVASGDDDVIEGSLKLYAVVKKSVYRWWL